MVVLGSPGMAGWLFSILVVAVVLVGRARIERAAARRRADRTGEMFERVSTDGTWRRERLWGASAWLWYWGLTALGVAALWVVSRW